LFRRPKLTLSCSAEGKEGISDVKITKIFQSNMQKKRGHSKDPCIDMMIELKWIAFPIYNFPS
jgi:hypothetical protein